jgi:hypothetical protein
MKKILKSTLAVAILTSASFGGLKAYEMYAGVQSNNLLVANVEALAADGDAPTLPVECYDKYKAYSSSSLVRFRPCDKAPTCDHIWAYSPRKKTMCPGSGQ